MPPTPGVPRVKVVDDEFQLELELQRRRLFVDKAERVDTAQLDLEFAATLAKLDELAGLLASDADDDAAADGDGAAPEPRPKGRPPRRRTLREVEAAIVTGYVRLCDEYGAEVDVAVRSSATVEDSADASFAGQCESYLNVHGASSVVQHWKRCCASLFTERELYRKEWKGLERSRFRRLLHLLESIGWLRRCTTQTGGRPSVVWHLNPQVSPDSIDV